MALSDTGMLRPAGSGALATSAVRRALTGGLMMVAGAPLLMSGTARAGLAARRADDRLAERSGVYWLMMLQVAPLWRLLT